MSRRGQVIWGSVLAVLVGAVPFHASAPAQESPDATLPGPGPTSPPTSDPVTSSTTSTSVVAPEDPTSTTTSPDQPTPDESTTTTTSTTSTTVPTLTELPEPEHDPEFQRRDSHGENYADQVPFDPNANAVVSEELREARRVLDDLEERHARALRITVEQARRLRELRDRLDRLGIDAQEALREAQRARELLEAHAVEAYVRGRDAEMTTLLWSADAGEAGTRRELLEAVLERDQAAADRYVGHRSELGDDLADLLDDYVSTGRGLYRAHRQERELRDSLTDARVEHEVWAAGSQVMAQGFVFPVLGPNTFGDSFGAPRMVGTADEHWHEGTDVMAARGTPLLAVEDGRVASTSSHHLGGIGVTMRGASGLEYYYAHLAARAEGISVGSSVTAGEVIGFVGTTGNAVGAHLHFEIHDRGRPVNPYPILRVAWDWQAPHLLRAAGRISSLVDGVVEPPSGP